MRQSYSWVLGLVGVFVMIHGAAQEVAPVALKFAAPFTATAAELRSASVQMPTDSRYGAQILFEEGSYRIGLDGMLLYRHRLIYRVDLQSSVAGWSEISANWDPWFEKPVELRARVLEGNDHFTELDQKTVTDAAVKADDSETYSSGHVRRAPLPGVAVGAIVEEMETTEDKVAYFTDGSLYGFAMRNNVPTGLERLIVDVPASKAFKDRVTGRPSWSRGYWEPSAEV